MTEMTPAQIEEVTSLLLVAQRQAIQVADMIAAVVKQLPPSDLPEPSRSGHYS